MNHSGCKSYLALHSELGRFLGNAGTHVIREQYDLFLSIKMHLNKDMCQKRQAQSRIWIQIRSESSRTDRSAIRIHNAGPQSTALILLKFEFVLIS
jgi:hypothetical protein